MEQQTAALEASFDDFAAWCATVASCAAIGDVRTFVAGVVSRAEHAPIPSGRPGDVRPTNGLQVVDAVVSAMYDEGRWPALADAWPRPTAATPAPCARSRNGATARIRTAATPVPVLVVGTRNDRATPYSGAVSMASSLGNARVLTWEGGGHTAVGRSPCITRLAAAYLVSLALPEGQSATCGAGS